MAQPKKHWARALSDAVNMTTTIAASVAVGYFGGKWLDNRFETDPWLTLVGFLLGVMTAGKVMWDKVKTTSTTIRTTEDEKNQDSN